jgi:hypothetical protein
MLTVKHCDANLVQFQEINKDKLSWTWDGGNEKCILNFGRKFSKNEITLET